MIGSIVGILTTTALLPQVIKVLKTKNTSSLLFINMPILQYAHEIRSAVLLIHGEKVHSRYFSEDIYKKLKGDNKELMIISQAVHTDLYDQLNIIPVDKITDFMKIHLK